MSLFLPDGWETMRDLPLLTLLHGVYGSHWAWPFKGGAHRTAQEMIRAGEIKPVAIVMPSDGLWGEGSGYLAHEDADYESWIVDDVPAAVMENIPSVTPDSKRTICGLSMGGYGALRLGAKHAGMFTGISAHSSITHVSQLRTFVVEDLEAYRLTDADRLGAFDWLSAHRDRLPPLRFDCGTEDILIEENRELHRRLDEAGIVHRYQEFSGGHEWPYWIEQLHLYISGQK